MHDTWFILAGSCLAGTAIRTGYELGKKTGRIGTRHRALFGVVSVAMGTLLSVWPAMCPTDPWRMEVPGAVRWIGLALAAAGPILAVGGLVVLRGLENIDHLVTTGLFARIRHPMYTGFILWIAGWVVRSGATASFVVGLVCIANILYWRHLEEVALASRYGKAYLAYRRTTWF